ncbi:hypothetical protein N0V82_004617 [Gnomoniopsis sp. IMI 355080]|nr:hypothetical protein N0V82_004617 [Gnomoniopsis sp. IMI 355080]
MLGFLDTMEPTNNLTPSVEQHSGTQALRVPEDHQATSDTMAVKELFDSTDASNNSGLKLAGSGMTKFHLYNDLSLELRERIMQVNMYEDKDVFTPRIIKIHMQWSPEEDECFGNHDLVAAQPWEESDEDEDDEDRRHYHVYPDHENFAWRINGDSLSQVRRSHRPLIPYFTVSKECKAIVKRFILCQMGRRCKVFRSPDLRKLPLNPQEDIFYIDCARTWEAVNEWGSTTLRAARDALQIRHFMVDFPTFHGLVEPSMREKDEYLLSVSNKEPIDYFRGESSMRAVFKNAHSINVLAAADKRRVTNYQSLAIWNEEAVENAKAPGLLTEAKEVLRSVWSEKNTEFNGLRDDEGVLPEVLWATAADFK